MVRSKIEFFPCSCFFILSLMLGYCTIGAQGLLLDEDHDTRSAYKAYTGNKSYTLALARTYKIDLKSYAPRPQHQGEILSCTGWAVGYSALSIMNAVKNNWKDSVEKIKEHAFSALFIYNQIWKGNCFYSGSNIMDAGNLLLTKGDLTSKDFDRFKNRCDRLPKEEELKYAEKFKIQSFENIFSKEEPLIDKVNKTKLSLTRKLPVVIGISLKKNFKFIKPGDIYWNPAIGDTTFGDQHAMTVVGFDDSKGAFEIMNSWGPDWANGGFIWIKYADFAQYTKQAYHFIPFNYFLSDNEIELTIKLERPSFKEESLLEFKELQMIAENKIFKPMETIKSGDQLRINLHSSRSQLYVYCFSIDSKRNDFIHWPKLLTGEITIEQYNKFNLNPNSNLFFLPEEYKAFLFDHQGSEYVYILLSPQKITNFKESLHALKKLSTTNPYAALIKVFGIKVAAADKLKSGYDQMNIKTEYSDKMILPIIIHLNIQ